MNWFPGIEHRERQSGDMLTMFYVCGIEQKNVARAFIENVFGDNWCFFFFRVVVKEKTFTNTAAGNDYLLTACCFQKALNHAGTCQDEVGTVGAETGYFPPLFQSGFPQKFKGCSECLGGELEVMDFRSRILVFFLLHFGNCTSRATNADEWQGGIFEPRIFFQAAHDQVTYITEYCWGHHIPCVEHGSKINAAKRQAD